jgi:4-amino-4-deoxy-L-arabinose transferase-like glycosyltransferase
MSDKPSGRGTVSAMRELGTRFTQRLGDPWFRARTAVATLAAVAFGWNLGGHGWTNPFYTAVVQAGVEGGIGAVLTGNIDLNGFAGIDKPPLPVLLSYLSVLVFGLNPAATLLPHAVAGVLSVVLIMAITRRSGGDLAGVVAGVVAVLLPVSSNAFRSNQVDAVNVLGMLMLVYGALRFAEQRTLRWATLAAGGVFIATNAKVSLFLPLVAVVVVLFAADKTPFRTRLVTIAGLTTIVAASFLAWPLWFDHGPGPRPRLGSSPDGTALGLTLRYNLWDRTPFAENPGYHFEIIGYDGGGPLRLLGYMYIDEWAWLLPAALVGVLLTVGSWLRSLRTVGDERPVRSALPMARAIDPASVLMLGWFVAYWAVLSFSATETCCQHAYYLVVLVPPVAHFSALAFTALRRRSGAALATAAATVAWSWWQFSQGAHWAIQYNTIKEFGLAETWLDGFGVMVAVATFGVIAAGVIAAVILARGRTTRTAVAAALAVFAVAPMISVTLMNIVSGQQEISGGDPKSGRHAMAWTPPTALEGITIYPGVVTPPLGQSPYVAEDVSPVLLETAIAPTGIRWGAATLTQFSAAPLQLLSGRPVLAFGGTRGYDEVMNLEEFQRLVADGELDRVVVALTDFCALDPRYEYSSSDGHEPARILDWVALNGTPVEYDNGDSPWTPVVYRLDPQAAASALTDGNRALDTATARQMKLFPICNP